MSRKKDLTPQQSEQKRLRNEAIEQLEKLGGKFFQEDDMIFRGDKLIVPEKMNMNELLQFVTKKREELESEAEFHREFKYKPWDVAYCAYNVLKRTFGVVGHAGQTSMSFFGPSKTPPKLITVATGPNTSEQIPWGVLEIPALPKVTLVLGSSQGEDGALVGAIAASGPKKYRYRIQGIFELVEKELEENSLYRGKAFDGQPTPEFIDLSKIDPEKIVFSEEVTRQLQANVWGPIQHPETSRKMGLRFKRAILFSGDFGTGKSLAVNRTGQVAVEQGITFVLVRPGRDDLLQSMQTARMYQPSIIAFEDVETVAASDNESRQMSEILDMFDGIEAKNNDVMLVLTTNHEHRLHQGMLRPGRLDAIIEMTAPDVPGIRRLVEVNMPDGTLDSDIDWELVGRAMESYLPAFVVEAAQRSIRYLIARTNGAPGEEKITTIDLCDAADGLRPQFDLMTRAKTGKEEKPLDAALAETVKQGMNAWAEDKGIHAYDEDGDLVRISTS